MSVTIWLVAAIVFLLVEILTTALVSVWFVGGSLVAALLTYLGLNMWWQAGGFALVSILMFLIIRPIARKHVNTNTVATNADRLIGESAVVTEEIDNLAAKGQVRLKGQIWTARNEKEDQIIPEGSQVTVLEINGVKLIVRQN